MFGTPGLLGATAAPVAPLLRGEAELPAPSPDLVRDLAGVELADLTEFALVELVGAWEAVAAWVAAQQVRTVQELMRRTDGTRFEEFLPGEVALALREHRRAGEALVSRARALEATPALHEALHGGRVTVRKVDALLEETSTLPPDQASDVHTDLLARCPWPSTGVLRGAARRAVLACDPTAAERRHRRARARRGVWLEPAPDAMARLTAYLPAEDAVRAFTALDALAAAAAPGDDRGVDARRADALADALGSVLDRGTRLDGRPLPRQQGRRPHLVVTVSLPALLGLSAGPAELAGYGPVPVGVARVMAEVATWSPAVVDPSTGEVLQVSARRYRPPTALAELVTHRDRTCTFPGCRVPAARCDVDHITPYDPDRPPEEQTRSGNLAALCRHHHRMKTHGDWTPRRDPLTGVTTWTSRTGRTYSRDPESVPAEPMTTGRTPSTARLDAARVLRRAHLLDPGTLVRSESMVTSVPADAADAAVAADARGAERSGNADGWRSQGSAEGVRRPGGAHGGDRAEGVDGAGGPRDSTDDRAAPPF